MNLKRVIFTLLCTFCVSNTVFANLIINGDFENHSYASTAFNQSNAAFTSNMSNATGFGGAQEIDVITGTDFGITPQSGNWKVGVHDQTGTGQFDAFSLDLSSPLTTGTSYTLSLWLAGNNSVLGPLEIGLSSSASTFGSLVASPSATSSSVWSQFSTTFSASTAASFLTFRPTNQSYLFIDNVSLTAANGIPEPTTLALMTLGVAGIGFGRKRK